MDTQKIKVILSAIEHKSLSKAAEECYDRVEPKPGVMSMLKTFREAGIPMALATMTGRKTVLRVLSRLGILSYLSHIFTCDEVGALKSSPGIYRAALSASGEMGFETPAFASLLADYCKERGINEEEQARRLYAVKALIFGTVSMLGCGELQNEDATFEQVRATVRALLT